MRNKNYFLIFILIIIFNTIYIYNMCFSNNNNMSLVTNVKINPRNVLTDKTVPQDEMDKKLPSIPFGYFRRNSHILSQGQPTAERCANFPDFFKHLQLQNTYWQVFKTNNFTYLLYGAYYDNRQFLDTTYVRVLAMIESLDVRFLPHSYCQVWFDNQPEALILPVNHEESLWLYDAPAGFAYPYVLSCELKKEHMAYGVPKAVSLVKQRCDRATNILKVNFNSRESNEQKEDFVVCVKGLDFPYQDISKRLAEWFETLRILGAKKVSTYNFKSHENVGRTLEYYENTGFVEVTHITLSSGEPNLAGFAHMAMENKIFIQMMHEVVSYYDCYMKHMYKFEHIVLIDIDELIVPQNNFTYWSDVMAYAEATRHDNCEDYASICFKNAYFPINEEVPVSQKVPHHFHMLQHVIRLNETLIDGIATKCIHNSEKILAVHNHKPVHYEKTCDPRTLDSSIGILNHYRIPDFDQTVEDAKQLDFTLWRFKDQIIERTDKALSAIFLSSETHRNKINVS